MRLLPKTAFLKLYSNTLLLGWFGHVSMVSNRARQLEVRISVSGLGRKHGLEYASVLYRIVNNTDCLALALAFDRYYSRLLLLV